MQKIAPSARSLQRAKVMWDQSNDDLRTARDLQNSNPELSCLQSVQAAINALSSLLEAQGFFQLPSYSAVELLDLCVQQNANELESTRSACYILDSSLERDIFGNTQQKNIRFTPPYAKTCQGAARQIHEAVRRYLKNNRDLFFTP
jgi:HEPN domain-containing protein